jgi:hypothetical protein
MRSASTLAALGSRSAPALTLCRLGTASRERAPAGKRHSPVTGAGAPRARVTMKADDVAAMPADIRHQGYSTKRSMLYVWENVTTGLPQRYERGELSPYPVDF